MKNNPHIHWGAAILGFVVAEASLIGSAFGWVAIYSYLISPGQELAVYEQHAQESGPWVSIVVGIPLFYSVARWITRSRRTTLVMVGLFLAFDAAILALAGAANLLPIAGLVAVSYLSKLAAAWWASAPNEPASVPKPR